MDQRIKKALSKTKRKKYSEAQKIYEKIIKENPNHLDANYLLGTLYAQRGIYTKAEKFLEKALLIKPQSPMINVNLANIHKANGQLNKAEKLLRFALSMDITIPEANFALGQVLALKNQDKESIHYFTNAIEKNPNFAEAHHAIGTALLRLGVGIGLEHLKTAKELNPGIKGLQRDAGLAHLRINDERNALECFKIAHQQNPSDPISEYFLTVLSSQEPSETLKKKYIENEFDNFALSFESVLVEKLDYRTPSEAYQLIKKELSDGFYFETIGDLGCGTGLNGSLYRDRCTKLVGIDMSSKMLKEAQKKGCYDELIKGEICEVLNSRNERYDLFVIMDVANYIGDLSSLFSTLSQSANTDGYVLLSTETSADLDFKMQTNGRYAHHADYVNNLASQHSFQSIAAQQVSLRKEGGTFAPGQLHLLQLVSNN